MRPRTITSRRHGLAILWALFLPAVSGCHDPAFHAKQQARYQGVVDLFHRAEAFETHRKANLEWLIETDRQLGARRPLQLANTVESIGQRVEQDVLIWQRPDSGPNAYLNLWFSTKPDDPGRFIVGTVY